LNQQVLGEEEYSNLPFTYLLLTPLKSDLVVLGFFITSLKKMFEVKEAATISFI
jgi:hypothetical protein